MFLFLKNYFLQNNLKILHIYITLKLKKIK
jgi:hypothetical protein